MKNKENSLEEGMGFFVSISKGMSAMLAYGINICIFLIILWVAKLLNLSIHIPDFITNVVLNISAVGIIVDSLSKPKH